MNVFVEICNKCYIVYSDSILNLHNLVIDCYLSNLSMTAN